MGSLSKKVPYPRDNFLLSACQFMASSQGKGKFTDFVCLHGANSISQKSPKFYLLKHYVFHLFAKVFLPIRCFTHSPKFSTIRYYIESKNANLLIYTKVGTNKILLFGCTSQGYR